MARPTGRPPLRQQPTITDTSTISSSSEANSHMSSGSNRVDRNISNAGMDCELSLDTFLDSIGMQQTDSILNSSLDGMDDMQGMDLFPQQPTAMHSLSPVVDVTQQHTDGDFHPPPQSAPPPYQLGHRLILPREDPSGLALPAYSSADRAGILLSQLHLELCKLLFCVQSVPWDVQDALRLTITSPESDESQDRDGGDPHPLVRVAKAIAELEKLLASLPPSAGEGDQTPPETEVSYHPGQQYLSTTQLLVALSCYIQIVSIYDNIFTTVFEYLASSSPTASLINLPLSQQPQQPQQPQQQTRQQKQEQTPSTPTLYLCGLPISPNRKLYGTLLVHQIEHQLGRIEMLVGLPKNYRISSTPGDVTNGLFAGQHYQSLLNAVFQLGEYRSGEYDTRCVRSLKRKMRQIKDL